MSIRDRIFAHRGASGYYCENTRSAFLHAHSLGFRHVEIDCQLSGDGQMIVFHDDDLSRLSGVNLEPRHASLSTLQSHDLHFNYADISRPPEKILSLTDFLSLCISYNFCVNFEIKPGLGDSILTGLKLAEILNKYYSSNFRPIISSFDFVSLSAFRSSINFLCDYALLYDFWSIDILDEALSFGADALHFRLGCVSRSEISLISEHNLLVRIYTVNDKLVSDELFSWGVDSVFSDFPDRLL